MTPSQGQRDACNFKKTYKLLGCLGSGTFATVYRCVQRETSQEYAVKVFNVSRMRSRLLEAMDREIEIQNSLKHRNIVRCVEVVEESGRLFMVQELLEGPDLLKVMKVKKSLPETTVALIVHNVCSAVREMHRNGIVHRDLKPANILLPSYRDEPDTWRRLKVTDFGLAGRSDDTESLLRVCGTPLYMAPEVLLSHDTKRPYGHQCDLWSVGVITYMLLHGAPPFFASRSKELFQKIKTGKYKPMTGSQWDTISRLAKSFVSKLLVSDPAKRMSAPEALQHRWMQQCCIVAAPQPRAPPPLKAAALAARAVARMRLLGQRRRLQTAVQVIECDPTRALRSDSSLSVNSMTSEACSLSTPQASVTSVTQIVLCDQDTNSGVWTLVDCMDPDDQPPTSPGAACGRPVASAAVPNPPGLVAGGSRPLSFTPPAKEAAQGSGDPSDVPRELPAPPATPSFEHLPPERWHPDDQSLWEKSIDETHFWEIVFDTSETTEIGEHRRFVAAQARAIGCIF